MLHLFSEGLSHLDKPLFETTVHHDAEDKAGKRVKQATEDDPGEQDNKGKGSY